MSITEHYLLAIVQHLEIQLHQPSIRKDKAQLSALLHDNFLEFGSSGKVYTKPEILEHLPSEPVPTKMWAQDFCISILAEGVVLLTYRAADQLPNGNLTRHTLRASIWQLSDHQWQMRFHQGTPTSPFLKS